MNYKIEIKPFMELVYLYKENRLKLNPPYQRNSIWSLNSQKLLIDTIRKGWPLPTFFIQEKNGGFEMVDGQQRTRALLSYIDEDEEKSFTDKDGLRYRSGEFDNYVISVVTLNEEISLEEIREFYVRVNKSGAKLERPELNKAEYYNTRFLKISTDLSEMIEFRELRIFSNSSIRRMFDRDYVEEIAALILTGPTDKKLTVDQLFRTDITESQAQEIKSTFTTIMETLRQINDVFPLSDSRFSQKNDFYTLFHILTKLRNLDFNETIEIYKVLLQISKDIRPSNDECSILKEYAEKCVTQSNSKQARIKRSEILSALLLNERNQINEEQLQVAKYYHLTEKLQKIGPYYTLVF